MPVATESNSTPLESQVDVTTAARDGRGEGRQCITAILAERDTDIFWITCCVAQCVEKMSYRTFRAAVGGSENEIPELAVPDLMEGRKQAKRTGDCTSRAVGSSTSTLLAVNESHGLVAIEEG